MKKKIGLFIIVGLVSIIWGFSFLGTKIGLEKLSPMELLAMRWTLGAITLIVLALLKVIKVNLKGKSIKPLLVLAALQPCIYSICECEGIDRTTASESSILIAMIPLFVALISIAFCKKKVSGISVMAIIMAFIGVAVTIVFSPAFSLGGKAAGYLFLLGAVITGAIYTVYCNKIGDDYNPMEMTLVMAISGSIMFNAIMIAQGSGLKAYVTTVTDMHTLLAILFLGFGCTAFCYVGYNMVITMLPAHQASALQANLITLVGVISGILVKGDPCGWYTLLGMALIIAGIVIINMQEGKAEASAVSQ